jgi:hypothetical protein
MLLTTGTQGPTLWSPTEAPLCTLLHTPAAPPPAPPPSAPEHCSRSLRRQLEAHSMEVMALSTHTHCAAACAETYRYNPLLLVKLLTLSACKHALLACLHQHRNKQAAQWHRRQHTAYTAH